MRNESLFFVVLALGVGALGCKTEETSESSEPPGGVTYYRDVAPILNRSCVGCHQEDQIGGFALDTYESARQSAGVIAANVESGRMPPFYAKETDECDPPGEWVDDPRLSEEEIAILRAWSDADAPEGDPADAQDVDPVGSPELDRVDVDLGREVGSVIEGTVDQFHCVTFDPGFDEPTWVGGIHLAVDNPKIAHHAITSIVKRDAAEAPDGEYVECFGGTSGPTVHAWVPGGKPFDLPSEVGILVQPDEVFVVQMHYHPTGDSVETDASRLQLRLADAKPAWQLRVELRGNARNSTEGLEPGPNDDGEVEFLIPANVEGHTEEMTAPVATGGLEVPLFFVAGHMHLVGRDFKVSVEREGAEDQCMLQIPTWDFSWQLFYQFDANIEDLPKLKQGDRLRIRCTYDNTMKNPNLAEALQAQGLSAPVDVSLGEQTLDEMCIAALGVLVPTQ